MIISRSSILRLMALIYSFYDWVVFHCIYIYHTFFIHSSVDEHLGCFHVFTTVNSAAFNIGVHVSFWSIVLPGCMPRGRRKQWQPTPVLLPGKSHEQRSLVGCSYGVATSRTWLSDFTLTFHFHTLEKEMATHSSVLAWRIPGMEEPGGLPSMGSHRAGNDWGDLAAAAAAATQLLPGCLTKAC